MFVSSLQVMEQIVDHRPDLEWNGWDVIHYKKSDSAEFSQNAAFKNGSWYKKIVYPITENGWSIPNYMGLSNDI